MTTKFQLAASERRLIIGVLVIAAVFLMYKYVHVPLQEKNRAVTAKLEVAEARLDKLETAAKRDLDGEIRDVTAEYAPLELRLPNDKQIPRLLVFLQDSADSAGVNNTVLNPGTESVNGGLGTIAMKLSYAGSYSQQKQFLAKLEESTRILQIHSLQISGSGDGLANNIDFAVYTDKSGKAITALPPFALPGPYGKANPFAGY